MTKECMSRIIAYMKNIKNFKNILTIVVVVLCAVAVWRSSHRAPVAVNQNTVPSVSEIVFTKASDQTDPIKKSVLSDATKMDEALIHQDYKTFASFTYPKIVTLLGGEKKMTEIIKKSDETSRIISIDLGNPSDIITSGKELQTTVPTKVTITMLEPSKKGKLIILSTLIGISENSGKSWYFLDTSGKTIETLRTAIPNLSEKIVVPAMPQPVFTKE